MARLATFGLSITTDRRRTSENLWRHRLSLPPPVGALDPVDRRTQAASDPIVEMLLQIDPSRTVAPSFGTRAGYITAWPDLTGSIETFIKVP
jgi:hypothetical protein